MIKKQVDFEVRVRPFTENQPSQLPMLKAEFPSEDGWELLGTQVAQVGGNTISIMFTFARYEYVIKDFVPAPLMEMDTETGEVTVAKRGRGRPPKTQAGIAGEEIA